MGIFKLDDEDLQYHLEIWDASATKPERTVAAFARPDFARAAVAAVATAYPKNAVLLRQGIRVLNEYPPLDKA